MCCSLLAVAECVGGASPAAAQLRVPIQVTLPEGHAGPAPVTLGIPLPPTGPAYDPAALTVIGPHGPIPSQIRAAARTGPGGAVSWALVDFQAEPDASYVLSEGRPPAPPVQVSVNARDGGGYVVDTGAGRYEVVPTSNILGPVTRGEAGVAHEATWGAESRPAQVQVIESGPLRGMLEVRSEGAVAGLDVIARLHFFAGLPYARVRLTLVNHTRCPWGWEVPNSDNGVCGVQATQPACNGLDSAGRIAVEDVTWALRLAASMNGEEVIYQDSSGTPYWNRYGGRGPRMQSGAVRRGFLHTRGGVLVAMGDAADGVLSAGGVRIDVPRFRETFPKALRARNDRLEIGLLPGEFSLPHRLRAGEQTTLDVWIGLDPAVPPPWAARAVPGFAWLRSTAALGPVGPRTDGAFAEYEDYVDAQLDSERPSRLDCNNDTGECARSVLDAQQRWDYFGWTDFGDLPTDFEHPFGPYNLKYDVNLGFLHQALRTGDPRWWKWAEISSRHFADIDILHARVRGHEAPRAWFEGGTYGHSLHNEIGLTNPHRNCNNPAPDTYWGGTGMAAWALLTGDEVVREAAIELADNVLWRVRNSRDTACDARAWGGGNGSGYAILDTNPRAVGNIQRILVWAWRLTGDRAYLDAAGAAGAWVECEAANLSCGSWGEALLARSMGEYLMAASAAGADPHPGAESAFRRLVGVLADRLAFSADGTRVWFNGCTGPEINAWMFLGADVFALAAHITGDAAWLDLAAKSFQTAATDPYYPGDDSHYHSSKELVNALSAGTMFLHFAAESDPPPPPPATATPTPTAPPTPTPFSAAARRCQNAIARAGRQLFLARLRALQACRNAINRGALEADPTDCAADPRVTAAVEAAYQRARAALTRRCPDEVLAGLAACAANFEALIGADGCLPAVHVAAADAAVSAQYGAALDPLDAEAVRCQQRLGVGGRRYATRQLALLQRCRVATQRGSRPADLRCAEDPRLESAVSQAAARMRAVVASQCPDAVLARIGPCAPTLDALISADLRGGGCLVANHDSATTSMLDAQYGSE